MDHLIHSGSSDYLMALTDYGKVHVYHIHSDSYRGTIQVPRGSLKLTQDGAGLYLGVISPQMNLQSYAMCNSHIRMIGASDYFDAEKASPIDLQRWQEKGLRKQLEGSASDLLIYELGTGKLKHHL